MLPISKSQADSDCLISQLEMLTLARQHNIFITKSTIYRWSQEDTDFPFVAGIDGQSRLYSQKELLSFLKRRMRKMQDNG